VTSRAGYLQGRLSHFTRNIAFAMESLMSHSSQDIPKPHAMDVRDTVQGPSYWWSTSGRDLANMLHEANYPEEA